MQFKILNIERPNQNVRSKILLTVQVGASCTMDVVAFDRILKEKIDRKKVEQELCPHFEVYLNWVAWEKKHEN
jgi:hypothetical protein